MAPLIHWDSNLADQTSLSTSAMSVQLSPITVSNDNAVDSLLPGEGEWVGVLCKEMRYISFVKWRISASLMVASLVKHRLRS